MKKVAFNLFALLTISVFLGSCIKHEVVPAPIDIVEKKVHFEGMINGTYVEYTDDVDGFNGVTSDAKYIVSSPQLSSYSYFCTMSSNIINRSLTLGIGSLYFDAGATEKPNLTAFNNFFTAQKDFVGTLYKLNAKDGFQVSYTDNFGNSWLTDETSVNQQSVLFTAIENDSDNDGDYSKFTCEFSCYLYRTISGTPPTRDSLRIDNGIFQGWFQR